MSPYTLSPDKLINRIKAYNPRARVAFIEEVFQFAKEAHEGQMRNSGEPYITHPLQVATILADLELDIIT
nr:HD domain-containing protein [Clostridia bacterium]